MNNDVFDVFGKYIYQCFYRYHTGSAERLENTLEAYRQYVAFSRFLFTGIGVLNIHCHL